MSIRQDLLRRDDVSDEDIPDIIYLALELKAKDDEQASTLDAADVAAIAEELDIESAYVEKAIALRRQARQEAAEQDERRRQAARAAAARQKRMLRRGAIAAAALVLFAGLLAWMGARSLAERQTRIDAARTRLDSVLERFAAGAPEQLALVGSRDNAVDAAVSRLRAAGDIDARLEAANALQQAVVEALRALPEARDESASQMRLNVHYELTGMHNRIATERARLERARDDLRESGSSLTGKLARLFGFDP